ncbi:MAG: hypothetical protein ACREXX_01995, partial [Gammaproteobacteria bacterium]
EAVFVLDLEASVPFQAEDYPTYGHSTAHANFGSPFACPVVFWLAAYAAALVAGKAPDFWRLHPPTGHPHPHLDAAARELQSRNTGAGARRKSRPASGLYKNNGGNRRRTKIHPRSNRRPLVGAGRNEAGHRLRIR